MGGPHVKDWKGIVEVASTAQCSGQHVFPPFLLPQVLSDAPDKETRDRVHWTGNYGQCGHSYTVMMVLSREWCKSWCICAFVHLLSFNLATCTFPFPAGVPCVGSVLWTEVGLLPSRRVLQTLQEREASC